MAIFTDPVAQVVISDTETGTEWKFASPKLPYLTGVSLNYKMERLAAITCNFDIPYDNALNFLKANGPFKVGNFVKARIGYASGRWTAWGGGFLSAGGDGLSMDANGIGGQINVQVLSESYGYKVAKKMLIDAGWDPVKILTGCAEGMGLVPKVSAAASAEMNSFKLIGESRGQAIRKQTHSFVSSFLGKSYWEVIKKVCKNWNLKYWMAPEVGSKDPNLILYIYTQDEASRGADQDVDFRTYMLRGVIDEAKLQYPCLNWGPEGSGFVSWLANEPDPAAKNFKLNYVDANDGEIKSEKVTSKDVPVGIVGVVAETEPEDVEHDGVKGDESRAEEDDCANASAPVSSPQEARAAALSRVASGNAAQTGVITTLGMPDERPGNLCGLRGAGEIYDGTYLITKMTHTYASASFETSLTVLRQGRVSKAGAQEETSQGQMPSSA